MKIALTGDVMLGRLVNRQVVSNRFLVPEFVWGDILPLFTSADLRLINLECVVSEGGQPWNFMNKPFHFRAHPRAIEILQAARVDCATLANNHVLDYGHDALRDCLNFLDRGEIQHAGAGTDRDEALAPAFLDRPPARIAVIALTDNEPAWEATDSQPGVHHVAYTTHGLLAPYRNRCAEVIRHARHHASFVIISAHIGPNWGEPSPAMRQLAHELLDLGGNLYWGHSNHTPQGIEIYKGKVILHSTGDFIDDYAVDPIERNDLSFLFTVENHSGTVNRILLYPVRIEHFQVHRAKGHDLSFLEQSFRSKCRAFHTDISFQNGVGTIEVS